MHYAFQTPQSCLNSESSVGWLCRQIFFIRESSVGWLRRQIFLNRESSVGWLCRLIFLIRESSVGWLCRHSDHHVFVCVSSNESCGIAARPCWRHQPTIRSRIIEDMDAEGPTTPPPGSRTTILVGSLSMRSAADTAHATGGHRSQLEVVTPSLWSSSRDGPHAHPRAVREGDHYGLATSVHVTAWWRCMTSSLRS